MMKANTTEDLKQFQLEYSVHSSPKVLFNFLTTPAGLSEWFCDDVNLRDNKYTFIWDDSEQVADLVSMKPNKSVRYRWSNMPQEAYFEFRIEIDDLTKDVALIITDYAQEDEEENARLLWDTQINALLKSLGA